MLDPWDQALVRSRRRFFLVVFLLCWAFLAELIVLAIDSRWNLAWSLGVVFMFAVILRWGMLLAAPAERILEMPRHFFHVFAPDDPPTPRPDRTWPNSRTGGRARGPESSGLWDRELDQFP